MLTKRIRGTIESSYLRYVVCFSSFPNSRILVAVNGSVGIVIEFKYVNEMKLFQPLVKFIGHSGQSFTLSVSRFTWENVAPNGVVVSSRTQIPLILAWAITIHKSQGQTIPRLYVDLNGVFEYGQVYVALSRCVGPSSLQVMGFDKHLVRADESMFWYSKNPRYELRNAPRLSPC